MHATSCQLISIRYDKSVYDICLVRLNIDDALDDKVEIATSLNHIKSTKCNHCRDIAQVICEVSDISLVICNRMELLSDKLMILNSSILAFQH